MYTFLLTLLILDALFLIAVVLLQSGKGAGLAAEFGGVSSSADTFLGGRQAATLLTKLTWWAGGIFMALALTLAILSARGRQPGSILEGQFTPTTEQQVPTPLLPQDTERQQGQPPAGTPPEGGNEGGGEGAGGRSGGTPPEGS